MVRMTHPDMPDVDAIDVAESAVPVHRQSGWRTEDETSPPPRSTPARDTKAEEK